jgi:hypothetical protein
MNSMAEQNSLAIADEVRDRSLTVAFAETVK